MRTGAVLVMELIRGDGWSRFPRSAAAI